MFFLEVIGMLLKSIHSSFLWAVVQVLIHTKVAKYLEFKPVDGSFVYRANGKVYKVPITPKEAMKSSLLSMTEKARMGQFTAWVASVDPDVRKTWSAGMITKTKLPLDTMTGLQALLLSICQIQHHNRVSYPSDH